MSLESVSGDLLHHYGAAVIGLSVAADSLGLPVPGESALVAGATAGAEPLMSFPAAMSR